ncbi:PP2C family serine/threonine-protein phosphatase [Taibaiella koreensis]|uniref:PP2C family serine/threonine-protein phosphatase n=1 Tax=Taibaiella koreensis TaxID=1268548 RepID=UPI0019696CAE|nr:PP2C family serine/threonine-protein phosphatase [Taibaiella koreensis]
MEPKQYLELFLATRQPTAEDRRSLLEAFCSQEQYLDAASRILALQEMLMKDFAKKNRIEDIRRQQVLIPNGTVGKPYEARLLPEQYGWQDMVAFRLEGLDRSGLAYDAATGQLSGIPEEAGDHKLQLQYQFADDVATGEWQERPLMLIVNPDPRSLWKNQPSEKDALYWKEDEITVFEPLGNKYLVVSSKRGRSHANNGTFRDDDFAFRYFPESGWSLIAVSDGAGSARYAREGARVACKAVSDFFADRLPAGAFNDLDDLLHGAGAVLEQETQKKISHIVYHQLGGAARYAFRQLEALAAETGAATSDFHATLIFTLVKKYEQGYAILSFGVGDCPIILWYNDLQSINLMNKMDVGEFGGGTRFITLPEIFQNDTFAGRFGFKWVADFNYLVMMTDGIYDPKFEVEANLEKPERWQAFLADLQGNNPEAAAVVLDAANPELPAQLSAWMDFWSPGNHDDRTLAILF